MTTIPSLLSLVHVLGLVSGVGCATAKLTLLLKCKADQTFLPVYLATVRPLTRLIILGLALLTLSGVGWLLVGYEFSPLLVGKLVLVGTIWAIGPIIDNLVEPKFRDLAPHPGEQASSAFLQIQRRYVLLEAIATGLFYVIIVVWMLA